MTFSLSLFRLKEIRAFCAWAVLCAFLFRAFIPTGYMPDMQALEKGVFKITICTMDGTQSIFADKDGQPLEPHQQKKQSDSFCPFGWACKLAVKELIAQSFVLSFIAALPQFAFQEFFVARILFSSAQSRAPPVLVFI